MDTLLKAEGIVKNYRQFSLGPVSLEVPKGSVVGLIGENGAGKTTLIKALLGLIATSGKIALLPDTPAGRDVRQDIGVVLGQPGIPDGFRLRQVERVMRATYDCWDGAKFQKYAEKFRLPANTNYKEFSAGAKMKLGLAVALSHHPRMLILDEPAAGLDPVARDELNDILFEFTRNEEHGVLISSHILSDLERVCDYIAFMHRGRLLLFEEKDRLLERYGIFRCSEAERLTLPEVAVKGVRRTSYGDEVLIDRQVLPEVETGRTTIEDIMVLMVKGAEQ